MKRQLTHQTTLMVHILFQDDTGALAWSMLVATKMFLLLWHVSQAISFAKRELVMIVNDAQAAIEFTTKVLAICISSLAYGLEKKR